MCIKYHNYVNTYHVNAQGVDERMINVHYYHDSATTKNKTNTVNGFTFLLSLVVFKGHYGTEGVKGTEHS